MKLLFTKNVNEIKYDSFFREHKVIIMFFNLKNVAPEQNVRKARGSSSPPRTILEVAP